MVESFCIHFDFDFNLLKKLYLGGNGEQWGEHPIAIENCRNSRSLSRNPGYCRGFPRLCRKPRKIEGEPYLNRLGSKSAEAFI
jgi:hypothetical protein